MIARQILVAATIASLSCASFESLEAQVAEPAVPAEVALEVYATALAFYAPPRGQLRWIEPMDPDLRQGLIERLGDRFLPWTGGAKGSGGRLAVSPIESAGPDQYRLIVVYRHRTPHFDGPASSQAFLVGREDGRWRILARGPDLAGNSP